MKCTDCPREARAAGRCSGCYRRFKYANKKPPTVAEMAERILSRVACRDRDKCWNWTGARTKDGYGIFTYVAYGKNHSTTVHRPVYRHLVKDFPDHLTIDHTCLNTSCINPFHMEVVTQRVNVLRGNSVSAINSRKVECKWGHPFFGENLIVTRYGRSCRKCQERYKQQRLGVEAT